MNTTTFTHALLRNRRSARIAAAALSLAMLAGVAGGHARSASADGSIFKADLHVQLVSSVPVGDFTFYNLKVTNNGLDTATNVKGTGHCWYTWGPWHPGAGYTGLQADQVLGSINVGESRNVTIVCNPYVQKYTNVGLTMTFSAANELDPSDNTVRIGHTSSW